MSESKNNTDAGRLAELQKANEEIAEGRRAALNIMEDVIRSKEALRKSEEKYRTLFNSIDDAFCIIEMIFDEAGKPTDCIYLETNPAFVKHALQPMLGKRVKEVIPDFEQFWLDKYGHVAKTGKYLYLENVVTGLGDQWFQVSAFRTGGEESNKVAVLFRNITGQKKSELALRESEERKAFLLKLSDALRPLNDGEEIQATVTRIVMDHFKADRCYYIEIEGDRATIRRDAFRQDLPSVANEYSLGEMPVFKAVLQTEQPVVVREVETSKKMDDNLKQLCLQMKILSYLDIPVIKDGQPVGLLCITQCEPRQWTELELALAIEVAERIWSTVERAKAEEAVQHSEENYRAIVNQSIAGIFKMDLQGNIIFANEHFSRMTGYSIPELLQLTVKDIIYEEDLERTNALFGKLIQEGKGFDIEKRIIKKDNELIWVNNSISPVYNSHSKPISAVAVSIDITRQKNTEQQKDEFIGIASHELKTPVTSIKMYVELIQELLEEKEVAESARLVQKVNLQVDRLIGLINDLLDTSKIVQDRVALNPEQFDLNKLIREHVEIFQTTSENHDIVFNPGKSAAILTADRERIGQVVNNLISNAIKYSPEGGEVKITLRKMKNRVSVSVQDEGIGIPKDKQSKLFKRFSRITRPHYFQGVGLGLYISADIIHRHGGDISVKSPPDEGTKGSVFSFTLPLKKGETA